MNPLLVDLPETIEGEQILIRPWRAGDGAALFTEVAACRDHLRRYLPWVHFHSLADDSEEFVRKASAQWITRENLMVGIWHRETGELLGGSGLHHPKWEVPSFELGYWLAERHEGNGYMTEAVRLLSDFATGHLGAKRLVIRCDVRNQRSANVAIRLGFSLDGIEKNWGRNRSELPNEAPDWQGELFDCAVYSLT